MTIQTMIENTKKTIIMAEEELKLAKGERKKEIREEIQYMQSELRRLQYKAKKEAQQY